MLCPSSLLGNRHLPCFPVAVVYRNRHRAVHRCAFDLDRRSSCGRCDDEFRFLAIPSEPGANGIYQSAFAA
jgi:hypothetical protein